jgi:hypothetical protein
MPPVKYVQLGKGVLVLRLWESIGPTWPQIAILLLSKEEYKEFLKNPKNYLNGFKVYDKTPTKKVTRCHLARVQPHNPPSTYLVIVKHDMDCTSVAISSSTVEL